MTTEQTVATNAAAVRNLAARLERMSLVTALHRISTAREYLHTETCFGNENSNPYPCVGCPSPFAVAAALDHLDQAPRDARGARRIFHDARCVSGCGPDSDHADRTQSVEAAALRRFRATEADR